HLRLPLLRILFAPEPVNRRRDSGEKRDDRGRAELRLVAGQQAEPAQNHHRARRLHGHVGRRHTLRRGIARQLVFLQEMVDAVIEKIAAEDGTADQMRNRFGPFLYREIGHCASSRGVRYSQPVPQQNRSAGAMAYLALAAAVAGIAWSAILVRWAGIPGAASAFYRVLIAGVLLVPMRLARGAPAPSAPRAAAVAVAGGVFFALDIALWNTS